MKRMLLALAAAATLADAGAAAAQPRGDWGHRGYDRGYERGGSHWARGGYLPGRYRSGRYVVRDWGRYRLGPPPRGYAYYYTDDGDMVLAAIASGLIASVINGAAAQGYYDGYAAPYAAPAPVYPAPYYAPGYVYPRY
jgi:Ni/Co efflux regulator RcnB